MLRSVGVVIVDSERRFLLQKRDRNPSIYFPGMWGLFGGACDDGEAPEQALVREVEEELVVSVASAQFIQRLNIQTDLLGAELRERWFFSTVFSPDMVSRMTLREGESYRFFALADLPPPSEIVPFDLAAMLMYAHATMLGSQIRPQ
jgi:8-oxo-dGTP pyrophosphatase MutT (NUDIX family)